MDFLDPRKRRSHGIRLIVGYFLVGIVLVLCTVILVYGASGIGITKNGEVIENGLLFVNSKPSGADIYINGQLQASKTSARFVLPAGDYTLTIKKSGYRDWKRSFLLDESVVSHYSYPFLFPVKPQLTNLKSYASLPSMTTESPDHHWLLVEEPDASASTQPVLDEYDTTNLAAAPQPLAIPAGLLGSDSSPAPSLKAVEWSTDNKHVVLEHDFAGSAEFIVFDRTDPTKSFNVNQMFKVNPSQVALRNKSIGQLYLYDQTKQTLQVADTTQDVLAPPFLSRVLAFKPYGSTLITYVTDSGQSTGQVQARIWDNGQTHPLYTFNAGTTYLIDAAQFQGHWYYVAGSDKASRINLYEDPITNIQNPQIGRAVPFFSFSIPGATKVSFSANTHYIGIEDGQDFAVYDLEYKAPYRYTVKEPLTQVVSWMDGNRWIGASNGNVFITDYDNANTQLVTPTNYPAGGFFSSDYNQLITFVPSTDGKSVILERVDMRAGADLPKDGAQ